MTHNAIRFAYCKTMDIDLIDIIADEGYSASNVKRPGLQAALAMLRSGRASTLIVVKCPFDRSVAHDPDQGSLPSASGGPSPRRL